jgi:hypothetical protein
MLILEKSISYEPENIEFTFRGKQIFLAIRPLDADAIAECREKATVYRMVKDPETGIKEMGAYAPPAKLDQELINHIIADIKGVGLAKDKPLPVNRETKSKLVYMKPGEGEARLIDQAWEAAIALGKKRHAALEEELKNS